MQMKASDNNMQSLKMCMFEWICSYLHLVLNYLISCSTCKPCCCNPNAS